MHKQVARPAGFMRLLAYACGNTVSALKLILRVRPTLIFAQWLAPSGIVSWLASLLTGRRLFVTSHGTDVALLKKSALLRMGARLVFGRARRVFLVSNYLRETALDLDLSTPAKLDVCPMPARTDLFGATRVISRRPPLVLCVARFTPQKQVDVLLRALRQVRNQSIEFLCEVYGTGKGEVELRRLIDALELGECVSLRQPVKQEDLAELYAAARVTVLPSVEEGFGMTLVEAQLSGSAVIGARSGGITDIIQPDETGLLFEPGNVTQLATQLAALLTDDKLHHQLITAGRARARQVFSPETIARRYEEALGLSPRS
jgi:phosphatidylinositol alpha-1,6-mannosyltransferase